MEVNDSGREPREGSEDPSTGQNPSVPVSAASEQRGDTKAVDTQAVDAKAVDTQAVDAPSGDTAPAARQMGSARRWFGRLNLLLAVLLGFGGWAMLTALSTRPTFKALIDLSPQAQFSVGAETEVLLGDLQERGLKVRVDTFFGRIPQVMTPNDRHYAAILRRTQQLTRDLLVRYQELGGDSVEVVDYDIYRDFGPVRARKEELGGLREVQGHAENILVVSVGKRRRVLQLPVDVATIDIPQMRQVQGPGNANQAPPTLDSFDGETALSTAIRSLLAEGSPKIYFLTGYNQTSLTENTAESYSELLGALSDEGFDIGMLQLEAEGRVPDDAVAVALLEPRGRLSERSVEALVAYLRRGGRMFLNTSWMNVSGERWNPTFPGLGDKLGFRIGDQLVCHLIQDPSMPDQPGRGGLGSQRLALTGLASQHPVTRPLALNRRYPTVHNAREIRSAGDAMPEGVSFEPLLTTGRYGWLAPRDDRSPSGADQNPPRDPRAYGPRTVGAVVDVEAVDAPEDGPRSGHLVVVSALALLNGGGFQANADLGLNIFNWMVERTELVTVRGNRYVSTRIEPDPVQLDHSQTFLKRWVPAILLGIALLVLAWRRWS